MYEELFEAWKKEKENVELQALPRDFYANLVNYMKKNREESRMLDKKTTRARLMYREFENAKKLVRELVKLRKEKILRKTMTGKILSEDSLTTEEKDLHHEILPLTESYHGFSKNILRGQTIQVERKEKPKRMLVRFIQEIPAIIGSDMNAYGPYRAEDIATLPPENARILIKQGIAAEVEAKT
jgi:DNA replication factor GINS